jgi:cystathionine gamma-synthase
VHYPGLPTDPGYERAKRFMTGFGAMLSIQLDSTDEQAEALCTRVGVFTHAKSLGGIESLITAAPATPDPAPPQRCCG